MEPQWSGDQSAAQSSRFVLAVIPDPEMPDQLDDEIRRLLCICFPADKAAFSHQRAWHDSWPAYTVVARAVDNLVGHVGMVVRSVEVSSLHVRVAGVQNFCVAPSHRGRGLSPKLMDRALLEARRRGIPFGLLFCVPELERLYTRLGWRTIDVPVTMHDELGNAAPIPSKNIAMVVELSPSLFPQGPIDLQGRDW